MHREAALELQYLPRRHMSAAATTAMWLPARPFIPLPRPSTSTELYEELQSLPEALRSEFPDLAVDFLATVFKAAAPSGTSPAKASQQSQHQQHQQQPRWVGRQARCALVRAELPATGWHVMLQLCMPATCLIPEPRGPCRATHPPRLSLHPSHPSSLQRRTAQPAPRATVSVPA